MNTEVQTKSGILKGQEVENGILVFKGVPYALPPVGNRRFHRPEIIFTPGEERDCTKFFPAPIQSMFGNKPKFAVSEDCLYLNIWKPKNCNHKLPVMVWFYGGGFNHGRADDPEFDGSKLAQRDVILVTVSYRIGVIGFLAHKSLMDQDTEGLSGNYGLYDQLCALQWINENIGAFDGNASQVTIFGQSAGGISCRIHLTSPCSKGLFSRVIVESGGGLNEADPIRNMNEYAEIVDCALKKADISEQDLMSLDALELELRVQEATKQVCPNELFFYQPIIDNNLLSGVPGELIKKMDFAGIDIMCGTVTGDAWMFCRKVKDQIGNDADKLRGFALSPSMSWAQNNVEKNKKPVFTYFFERKIPEYLPGIPIPPEPKRDPSNKTPHASEIGYIFGTYRKQQKQWIAYDETLSDEIMTYWTNFAKTGDPNQAGSKEWLAYTRKHPLTMHFDDNGWEMKKFPENDMQQQVINFTIAHPGMLQHWEV